MDEPVRIFAGHLETGNQEKTDFFLSFLLAACIPYLACLVQGSNLFVFIIGLISQVCLNVCGLGSTQKDDVFLGSQRFSSFMAFSICSQFLSSRYCGDVVIWQPQTTAGPRRPGDEGDREIVNMYAVFYNINM